MPRLNLSGHTWKKFFLSIVIVNLFAVIFSNNNAFAEPYSRFSHNPANFSLSFSYANIDLLENKTPFTVNQRRISASIFNVINSYLDIGLVLGSSYLGLDNDTLTSGIDLNGNHIGFSVRGVSGNNPQLGYRVYYLYQDTKGSNSLRSATFTWVEWFSEASINFNIGSSWALNIGAGLLGIDARRRVTGDINDTLTLKNDTDFQGRLSINLFTNPDGTISMNMIRGAQTGVTLIFSRDY